MDHGLTAFFPPFPGRARRSTFWRTLLVAGAAFILLYELLAGTVGYGATLVLYPPLLWVTLAASVRRLRDRARSPAWLLAVLVPVLGPLWLAIELGFLRGTPGENPYGEDPVRALDYLTVK